MASTFSTDDDSVDLPALPAPLAKLTNKESAAPCLSSSKEKDNENEKSDCRLKLVKISRKTLNDGSHVLTPEFLHHTNLKDLFLLRSMIAHHPYKTTFGAVKADWKVVSDELSTSVCEKGLRVFSEGELKPRGAQNRFKEYIKYGNWDANAAMKRTGCDDERSS